MLSSCSGVKPMAELRDRYGPDRHCPTGSAVAGP